MLWFIHRFLGAHGCKISRKEQIIKYSSAWPRTEILGHAVFDIKLAR